MTSSNNKEDDQVLATVTMIEHVQNSKDPVNQRQWSEPPDRNSAQILVNNRQRTVYNLGLGQRHRPVDPGLQPQDSADFWNSLAGDMLVCPSNNMSTSSPAESFDICSLYPETTPATSVEPDASTFDMISNRRGSAMLRDSTNDASPSIVACPSSEGHSWMQGLCIEALDTFEPAHQPISKDPHSDTRTITTESELDSGWPILPDLEHPWDQNVSGPCGYEEVDFDTELGQPNLYPPLPDLAPLSAYNTLVTQSADTYTDPFMSPWPDQGLNDFTQHYDQTVLPSIEDNDYDFMWDMSQPQCSKSSTSSVLGRQNQANSTRKIEDEFLLDCKDRRKMSYKAIKALGGFREAESTLRGRYRTLSKQKEERLRKPEWNERDIHVLKQVVAQLLYKPSSISSDHIYQKYPTSREEQQYALNKIPWKKVAESMAARGCYKFGNATVKKKYMEVMGIPRRASSY